MTAHACPEPGCGRSFLDVAQLAEHAEAVHTFDDIRQQVAEALREAFAVRPAPGKPDGVYVWIADIADDWVVFCREDGADSSLQKVGYSIVDGKVSLGSPVEVVRRTVYEPVRAAGADAAADLTAAQRRAWAKAGLARPDGSFPIPNVAFLKKAVSGFGRAAESERAAVKAWIKKRARELNAENLLPDDWK